MYGVLAGRNKYIAIIVLLIFLIAIGLTLIVLQRQQNLRQEASGPQEQVNELAVVGGTPITRQDVLQYADTMYNTLPSDSETLNVMLNELIEKKVIELVANREGLTVSNEEIQRQIEHDGFTDFVNDPSVLETAREMVLKRKIERRFTKSRDAFTIGFWIPPENYGVPVPPEQVEIVAQQREVSDQVVSEMEERMRNGEDALDIALSLNEEYPQLVPIMSVNGYVVENEENGRLMTQPILYSYQAGRSGLPLYQSLFSLGIGEVATVPDEQTNAGGIVVKVVGSSNGPYDNYSDWYRAVRSQEVQIVSGL